MICNIFSCVSYFMVFFRFYLMDVVQSLGRKQRKLLTGVLGANPGDFISCSYSAWRRFWEGESLNPSKEDNLSCLWDAQALNRLNAHNLNVASCFRWIFSVIVQMGHGQTKVWEMGIILKIIEATCSYSDLHDDQQKFGLKGKKASCKTNTRKNAHA